MLYGIVVLGVGLTFLAGWIALGSINSKSVSFLAIVLGTSFAIGFIEVILIFSIPAFHREDEDEISHYEGSLSGNQLSLRPVTKGEWRFGLYWIIISVINVYFSLTFLRVG